ncbi:VWA domain-containing protein [Vibrio superstes]|uniref:Transporter n=1 Tax=Vibrio superstes NBRC 103154 TaxID=1219062 RepID=A0A511QNX0_9VIBR|nr:VWA domain-containing protein [Vibrio superstes]GEM79031.1 transporter [Vibrio superstes NBRC 103154]
MSLVDSVMQLHFLRPWALLFIFPFIFILASKSRSEGKKNTWIKSLPPHLASSLLLKHKRWTNQLPLKLLGIIGVLAVIIISGPSWYRQASPFGEDASPLVVVLDVSETMMEKDIAPNRLFIAKQKIRQLLEEHRVTGASGLIVYAGSAHVASPLTQDRSVYGPILDSISVSVMPREGKFAQYALSVLARMLKDQSQNGTVLLVTDALNLEAEEAYERYFQSSPHQLIVYGVGKASNDSAFPLNEDALKDTASSVNGRYVTMTLDDTDLQNINHFVERHQSLNADSTQPWVDAGYYLIWPVLLAYLMWFRKGWLVQWLWAGGIVILPLAMPQTAEASTWNMMDAWLTKDQQGRWLLEHDKPDQAGFAFDDNQWKAYSFYVAGEYKKAQHYYLLDDSLSGHLGLAASLAHQREYVAARHQYKEILQRYPDNLDAKNNLKVIEGIIAQIDQFTQSQSDNTERQKSRELQHQPKTSEGVTQEVEQDQLVEEKLLAEDLLADAQVHDRWMRRVQGELSDFMASKFAVQLQRGAATQLDGIKDAQ